MTAPSSTRNRNVITFDALGGAGRPMGPLPRGFFGFTWCENSWFLPKAYYCPVHTGHHVALFNAHGGDISFGKERAFDLTGLSLSLIWEDSAPIVIEGWEEGASRYRHELTIHRNVVAREEMAFIGIDRVTLNTGGVHIMVEDISVLLREA